MSLRANSVSVSLTSSMLGLRPDAPGCAAVYSALAAPVPGLRSNKRPVTAEGIGGRQMQMALARRPDGAPAPEPDERPIDLVHLARMTLGERSLEREVLALFDKQATILLTRMRSAAPAGVATLAHTLKGSARGIGAWRVARAAEALEAAGSAETGAALDALGLAVEEARAVIAELLKAN